METELLLHSPCLHDCPPCLSVCSPFVKARHWGCFGKPVVYHSPPWDLPGATLCWAAFHSSEESVCFRREDAARVVTSYWKASLQPVAAKLHSLALRMARKPVVAGRDCLTRSRRCRHVFNNAECFRAAIPTHPNNNPIRSVGISWRHNILHVTLTRQRPAPPS